MATEILAAVLTLCILNTQGAVIREDDDFFVTAMHTLITEPEMLMDTFGLTRDKRHAQGAWDFDHSFGGVTLQIKYNDVTNKWKGGHAHFQIENLKALVHVARWSHVSFDITFEGGAVPRDGNFNLKVEYIFEHGFEERGIFEFNRTHVGNHWISDISNKKNGGGNGMRIFPEMEFHGKNDPSTMDSTLEGNFWGTHVNITLHGTRDTVTNNLDGTLTIEIGPKKYDFKITEEHKIGTESELDVKLTGEIAGEKLELTFSGKCTEWTKFEGTLKVTYRHLNYQLAWVVDYTNGTKFIIKLNTGHGQATVIKYRRTANWDSIKFSFALMGGELLAFRITREIGGTWKRKTTIDYRGLFFRRSLLWGINGIFGKIGGPGKILLQVQEVNPLTKKFTVIIESKHENEFLKYVNTISHNTLMQSGHRELTMTMKDNMDLKENSTIHKFLCKHADSIHCFKQRETDITFNLNLDDPWHMLFVAKLNQDGSNVVEAKIDTKSQNLQTPYVFHLKAGRLLRRELPATVDAEVKKVGNNVVGIVKIDSIKKIEIDLKRTHKDSAGKHEHHFMGKVEQNKEVYYEYASTISYGGNSSQFELDANSNITVDTNSHLYKFACSPEMSMLNFLCFTKRTMKTMYSADKNEPYKMKVHTKVDMDGIEVFQTDMQTQASPYKLNLNWPRMRAIVAPYRQGPLEITAIVAPYRQGPLEITAIVAPYRQGPLEITANHNPGTSLAITSNIQGYSQFSVLNMPNGNRKVTLNNQEVVTTDFRKNGRSITQSMTLPDGRALMTTFKWGNDNNWLNNHIQLHFNGTEGKLDSKFEWNLAESQGMWKLDAVGQKNGWGDYNINRTGKYANNNGVWTFDVDGTALWKGNNVKTDVFIKLDTHKIGNGKLDAITAKLIKVVDGKKYEVNVTDGKITPGDFIKVGTFFREMDFKWF